MSQSTTLIIASRKSVFTALVLAFLFGPLGMLYSTIAGSIVMFIVTVIAAVFTAGVGLVAVYPFLLLPVCVIWAMIAASGHNTRISGMAAKYGAQKGPARRVAK